MFEKKLSLSDENCIPNVVLLSRCQRLIMLSKTTRALTAFYRENFYSVMTQDQINRIEAMLGNLDLAINLESRRECPCGMKGCKELEETNKGRDIIVTNVIHRTTEKEQEIALHKLRIDHLTEKVNTIADEWNSLRKIADDMAVSSVKTLADQMFQKYPDGQLDLEYTKEEKNHGNSE